MGGKGSALAVLLALVVALGFFAGHSSARSSSDFPCLIHGGSKRGARVDQSPNELLCKECACSSTDGANGGCACYDTFAAYPSFCNGGCWCGSDQFGCQCIKYIDQKWCETKVVKKPISDALRPTA